MASGQEYTALILAGGSSSGAALYPVTEHLPKCLAPVCNRPLLAYQLDLLELAGFQEALVLAVEEQASALREYLSKGYKGRLRPELVVAPSDLGPANAVLRLRARLQSRDFLVLSGDLIADPALLSPMADLHRRTDASFTIVLQPVPQPAEDEENRRKGGKKAAGKKEVETASEVVGLDESRQQLLLYQPADRLKDTLLLPKPLLRAHPRLFLYNSLRDIHMYLFSRHIWTTWEETKRRKSESFRSHLLPALVRAQWAALDVAPVPAAPSPAVPAASPLSPWRGGGLTSSTSAAGQGGSPAAGRVPRDVRLQLSRSGSGLPLPGASVPPRSPGPEETPGPLTAVRGTAHVADARAPLLRVDSLASYLAANLLLPTIPAFARLLPPPAAVDAAQSAVVWSQWEPRSCECHRLRGPLSGQAPMSATRAP